VVIALVAGCSRQSVKSDGANEQKSLPEANAFDGEAYRTKDRSEAITLLSKDELEIKRGGLNLICKYTRQDGQLRVVVTVMGTSHALYYRVTEDGLEDEKGTIFYKPSRFPPVVQPAISEQTLDQTWAAVCNVYQRRADLIPNLVLTVSGAANFEKSTLVEVMNAHTSVGRVQLDPNKAPTDAAQLEQFQAAQAQLSNALSRLLVVVERYPELRANQNFVTLQAQLEGIENLISVERSNFNTAVQSYNSMLPSGSGLRPFFNLIMIGGLKIPDETNK
jgi:hypothetical protein